MRILLLILLSASIAFADDIPSKTVSSLTVADTLTVGGTTSRITLSNGIKIEVDSVDSDFIRITKAGSTGYTRISTEGAIWMSAIPNADAKAGTIFYSTDDSVVYYKTFLSASNLSFI